MLEPPEDRGPVGPRPDAPRGAWRLVRGSVLLALAWLLLGVVLTGLTLFALLTFRIGVRAYFHHIARFCARMVLLVAGVEVRVVNPERLAGRRTRLVAFNHTSQLDLFVCATLLPPYGTPVVKREFLWVPVLGLAFVAFKVVIVDRADLGRAKRSLAEAARRLREERATVFITPEGTRSRDGRLGPFKMGLFHLAAAAHAPIIPLVLRGARECQPMGTLIPQPGVVEVELLPEIPTDDFGPDNLREKRDELRALYLRVLGEGEGGRSLSMRMTAARLHRYGFVDTR
jgi:1-acyl-sn-glycerol-3-phosphate acyltransferase